MATLRFDEISDRSVRVSWTPPEKINGILTGYTVRWSVKDMAHTLKVKNVSSDLTSLVVGSLQVGNFSKVKTLWRKLGLTLIRFLVE